MSHYQSNADGYSQPPAPVYTSQPQQYVYHTPSPHYQYPPTSQEHAGIAELSSIIRAQTALIQTLSNDLRDTKDQLQHITDRIDVMDKDVVETRKNVRKARDEIVTTINLMDPVKNTTVNVRTFFEIRNYIMSGFAEHKKNINPHTYTHIYGVSFNYMLNGYNIHVLLTGQTIRGDVILKNFGHASVIDSLNLEYNGKYKFRWSIDSKLINISVLKIQNTTPSSNKRYFNPADPIKNNDDMVPVVMDKKARIG